MPDLDDACWRSACTVLATTGAPARRNAERHRRAPRRLRRGLPCTASSSGHSHHHDLGALAVDHAADGPRRWPTPAPVRVAVPPAGRQRAAPTRPTPRPASTWPRWLGCRRSKLQHQRLLRTRCRRDWAVVASEGGVDLPGVGVPGHAQASGGSKRDCPAPRAEATSVAPRQRGDRHVDRPIAHVPMDGEPTLTPRPDDAHADAQPGRAAVDVDKRLLLSRPSGRATFTGRSSRSAGSP